MHDDTKKPTKPVSPEAKAGLAAGAIIAVAFGVAVVLALTWRPTS